MFNKQNIEQIKVSKITGSLFQMRIETDFDMEEMRNSIYANGILNPLMLKKQGNEYLIIAGHRRLKAAKELGLSVVPAIVYDKISDREGAIKGMVDNLNRRELTPLEQAIGYKKLIEQFQFTQYELAQALGKSQSIISEYVRTLEYLPHQVIKAVTSGIITFAHARVLLRLKDEDEILQLFEKIIRENITVDELKILMSRRANLHNLSRKRKELELIGRILEEYSLRDKTLQNYWKKEILLRKSKIGDRLQVDFRNSRDLQIKLKKLLNVLQTSQTQIQV